MARLCWTSSFDVAGSSFSRTNFQLKHCVAPQTIANHAFFPVSSCFCTTWRQFGAALCFLEGNSTGLQQFHDFEELSPVSYGHESPGQYFFISIEEPWAAILPIWPFETRAEWNPSRREIIVHVPWDQETTRPQYADGRPVTPATLLNERLKSDSRSNPIAGFETWKQVTANIGPARYGRIAPQPGRYFDLTTIEEMPGQDIPTPPRGSRTRQVLERRETHLVIKDQRLMFRELFDRLPLLILGVGNELCTQNPAQRNAPAESIDPSSSGGTQQEGTHHDEGTYDNMTSPPSSPLAEEEPETYHPPRKIEEPSRSRQPGRDQEFPSSRSPTKIHDEEERNASHIQESQLTREDDPYSQERSEQTQRPARKQETRQRIRPEEDVEEATRQISEEEALVQSSSPENKRNKSRGHNSQCRDQRCRRCHQNIDSIQTRGNHNTRRPHSDDEDSDALVARRVRQRDSDTIFSSTRLSIVPEALRRGARGTSPIWVEMTQEQFGRVMANYSRYQPTTSGTRSNRSRPTIEDRPRRSEQQPRRRRADSHKSSSPSSTSTNSSSESESSSESKGTPVTSSPSPPAAITNQRRSLSRRRRPNQSRRARTPSQPSSRPRRVNQQPSNDQAEEEDRENRRRQRRIRRNQPTNVHSRRDLTPIQPRISRRQATPPPSRNRR